MLRDIHAFFLQRQRSRRVRFHVSAHDLDVILASLAHSNTPAALSHRVVGRARVVPDSVLDRVLDLSRSDAQALLRSLHATYRSLSGEHSMSGAVVRLLDDGEALHPLAIRQARRHADYLRCLHGLLSDQYVRQLPGRSQRPLAAPSTP